MAARIRHCGEAEKKGRDAGQHRRQPANGRRLDKPLKETAARYQAMAERVQGQTVTERSKDGPVKVTVDAKGLLKNLVIAESAAGKRMAEVSALVMQLVQRAQSRIPELLQQATAETIGSGDQAAVEIVREAQSTFPQPPPEPEPAFPEPDHGRRFIPEDTERTTGRPHRRAPRPASSAATAASPPSRRQRR